MAHCCKYHESDHEYTEIDHSHDVETNTGLRQKLFQGAIQSAIHHVLHQMHDIQPIKSGEQWTVPVHFTCGFIGTVVLQVGDMGTCEPDLSDEDLAQVRATMPPFHGAPKNPAEEISRMRIQIQVEPDSTN